MYDCMLTDVEKAVSREAREFIKSEVSTELIKAMDKDEITYPREYVKKLGDRNLLGLRVPKKWGGRGLPWTAEVAVEEEIGVLGAALGCAYVMPSIVGEALNTFGTDEQKSKFLVPLLRGDLISAEALTEPRGGSDFFGATTRAVLDGDTRRDRTETVRRRRLGGRLLPGLLPVRTWMSTPSPRATP